MAVRYKRIEAVVETILQDNGVTSPPVAVEAIAKRHGLQIRVQPLDSDISGFIFRDSRQSIIGINSSQSKVRQRFTIAHELGHYLLHASDDDIHFDRSFFIELRDGSSSQGSQPKEIEANWFAAELLVPRDFLNADLQGLPASVIEEDTTIARLARRYNVSAQALTIRLMNLGHIRGITGR